MNAIVKQVAVVCVLMAAPSGAGAQDADPFEADHLREDWPKLIRTQVEWIEVDHPTLTTLLRRNRSSADDGDLRAACGDLIDKKEARILDTATIITRPGQKGTIESVTEYIYPTEYEPARLPNAVELSNVEKEALEVMTPPTPTAFETRNLGTTLEVEANMGVNNVLIDLRFAPEITYHVGENLLEEWENGQYTSRVSMPMIYSVRISTGTTLVDGQYQMVGVHSPKNEEGELDRERKLLVFVRCNVLRVMGK